MLLLGAIAESRGDMSAANSHYLKAAESGNAQAMWSLGVNYLGNKPDTERDLDQAMHWIHSACDAGYDLACWGLGRMYLAGNPVPRDVPQGLRLLERAAEHGNASACISLAEIYLKGLHGVPADAARARSLLVGTRPWWQRLAIRLKLARLELDE